MRLMMTMTSWAVLPTSNKVCYLLFLFVCVCVCVDMSSFSVSIGPPSDAPCAPPQPADDDAAPTSDATPTINEVIKAFQCLIDNWYCDEANCYCCDYDEDRDPEEIPLSELKDSNYRDLRVLDAYIRDIRVLAALN